jgi:hypothetical protein
MPRRHVTRRTLGVAVGGLLGAAFIPAAAAFADSYEVIPEPGSTETLTGVYGLENTAPPAETGSIQGSQEFEVLDTSTKQVVGTFDALESNSTDIDGDTNSVLLVTSDGTGPVGTAAGDIPAVGSVLDNYTYAGDATGYSYGALAPTTSGGADTIYEYLTTVSYGNYDVGSTFNAITAESGVKGLGTFTLGDGDKIEPVGSETFTAISGAPPYDMAVQGTQGYEILNSSGAEIGTFEGDVTTTTDVAGTTTEGILVTSDESGTTGTSAADVPAVGSVFNVIDYQDGAYPEVYSDLVSTNGGSNVISAVDKTLFGTFSIPTSFNAAGAESDSTPISFDGGSITPVGSETLTGMNGLPPADVAIQGTQEFDVADKAGTGSFDADVTTTSTSVYNETTETLLVTSSTGDAPGVGSVIDVANFGSGYESVYSDIISSTGASTITDTFVTPFGDFAIPTSFDATSGLVADTIALF